MNRLRRWDAVILWRDAVATLTLAMVTAWIMLSPV
jgi:hypothetical protein